MPNSSNPTQNLLNPRGVLCATASLSPIPGRVRITLDITPEAAYELSYGCTSPHLAGFAGLVDQAAFWAVWGRPTGLDEDAPTNSTVANPRTDPGE